ncbi:DUF1801 domain-containing protein [Niveispirillum fermenti]|uniref:DUF1801 domain-containing protein n=1 Tax=Niveispirillum fermenti TaxID=1233113 RepID=UPI003A86BC1E
MPPKAYDHVDAYLADLPAGALTITQGLRALIRACHPGLTETIKWNAPSFSLDGMHMMTLGLERNGAVRLVLHRGAKAKDLTGFHFDDPAGLARWPAIDRGVVVIREVAHLEAHSAALGDLVTRWIAVARG